MTKEDYLLLSLYYSSKGCFTSPQMVRIMFLLYKNLSLDDFFTFEPSSFGPSMKESCILYLNNLIEQHYILKKKESFVDMYHICKLGMIKADMLRDTTSDFNHMYMIDVVNFVDNQLWTNVVASINHAYPEYVINNFF